MKKPSLKSNREIIDHIKRVIELEAGALGEVGARVDESFARAVRMIAETRGRVVVTGLGKSGLVARKIAATLSSTGTPAVFLHPVEALHGDVGMVLPDDLALIVSNSGNTDEIAALLPLLRDIGVATLALVGHTRSRIGREVDLALDVGVSAEACILDLAPTCSTTAALAVGDALAVAVSALKKFSRDDYARLHMNGAIGRRLTLRVRDVMCVDTKNPILPVEQKLRDAILAMTRHGVGTASVVDKTGRLAGVLTDGDLRRALESGGDGVLEAPLKEVMTPDPKTVTEDQLCVEVVEFMQRRRINAMPVLRDGSPYAMVHLHDLLAAGIADQD